jgi:hypothetical protein
MLMITIRPNRAAGDKLLFRLVITLLVLIRCDQCLFLKTDDLRCARRIRRLGRFVEIKRTITVGALALLLVST